MLFFTKNKPVENTVNSAPHERSLASKALRFALLPELGSRAQPIGESLTIFINLLAAIFISQKMFPANHPGYLGINGQRLGFRELITTVWHNLEWKKENLAQITIFCTLIAGLIFAGLAFVTLMLSIFGTVFVSKAHAQGAGYFTSPAGADIAQQWIDFFRSGGQGEMTPFGADATVFIAPIVAAMITALGFYSHAILIVAAVILFYHLSAMVVETAHHGVVMGKKADQIWAPIRLVVAIGLLVPIGGGLNSGQYIVFKMTEWGSGLASNLWAIFLDGFAVSEGVPSVPQYAPEVVYNTMLMEACKYTYNAKTNKGADSQQSSDPPSSETVDKKTQAKGGLKADWQNPNQKDLAINNEICGKVARNDTSTGTSPTAQAVKANAQSCYDQMDQQSQQRVQQYANQYIPKGQGGQKEQGEKPYDDGMNQVVSDWMSCIAAGLPNVNLLAVFAESATWGWLSAGALLSAISQAEADANDLGALIPTTQAPNMDGGNPIMKETQNVVGLVGNYINSPGQGGGGGGAQIGSPLDKCTPQRSQLMEQAQGLGQQGQAQNHFLDRVFQAIDWLAQWNCVWVSMPPVVGNGAFSMGIMFMGANPLAEMARLGQACINTAYDAFDIMVNLALDKGKKLNGLIAAGQDGDIQKGGLTFVNTILGMITSVFFTSGILLAYYVPLIPFIAFLFSVLSWILAVLEAVIAIPLLALAHLTVQGEGLPGAMAKAGYFFLFNIALRPALMVFGLVVGISVFCAAISYMNLLYPMAISTSGGLATSHLFLSRLVYNGIYVIILYICANASFKAIDHIPNHAMKWMSMGSMHFAHMGDPKEVAGPLLQGAGNISQVTSGLTSGGTGAGMVLSGSGENSLMGNIQSGMKGPGGAGSLPAPKK